MTRNNPNLTAVNMLMARRSILAIDRNQHSVYSNEPHKHWHTYSLMYICIAVFAMHDPKLGLQDHMVQFLWVVLTRGTTVHTDIGEPFQTSRSTQSI